MAWSGEHRAFVVEQFVKNGESVVATQRSFRRHFSQNVMIPYQQVKQYAVGFPTFDKHHRH